MQDPLLYVGTYTGRLPHVDGKADGIYVYRLNQEFGALSFSSKFTRAGVDNPSFVALHPEGRFLYAVNEESRPPGCGAVSAFEIDKSSGDLTFLNQQPSWGAAPCHLCVEATGRWLLTATYLGGSVVVYPIEPDGRLGPKSDQVRHSAAGCSPGSARQEKPHVHSITMDPTNRFALVADLGTDQVVIYRLDLEYGRLIPHGRVRVAAGSGPRHIEFHPNGRYVYLINELNATLTAFAFDREAGALSEIQTVGTLPEDGGTAGTGADVHVHPSGQFLYGSNRGHDSLVVMAVSDATGRLELMGHEPSRGKTPRNFAIDPEGLWLLVANQDSDTAVTFHINPGNGKLDFTGEVISMPTPVCLKFLKIPGL